MFTGIVEELGEVVSIDLQPEAARLSIRGAVVTEDVSPGGSIAVNGVCLTAVTIGAGTFTADVMHETLRRSALSQLAAGAPVNLERAVRAGDRLGGHLVQGHVDGVGLVQHRTPGAAWELVRISLPGELRRYVVEKGSIAADGASLTVSAIGDGWFEVSLIPTTLESTTLGRRAVGDQVNLEVDVLAKYVERLVMEGQVR